MNPYYFEVDDKVLHDILSKDFDKFEKFINDKQTKLDNKY